MVIAMILAGGTGTRVGLDRPKQFVEVRGKPVLAYTIEIFQKHIEVNAIEVVCHKEWKNYLERIISLYNFDKVKWITDGGNTFQASVINGMKNLEGKISNDDIVIIHYGAAPFTSKKIISEGINVCRKHGMSASCTPCFQLLGTNDSDGESHNWVDRDKYLQIACPQNYRFSYLKEIYNEAEEKGLLELVEPHTTSLMYALGKTVYQSYGDQTNIKITTIEDLKLFEGYVLYTQTSHKSFI